MNEHLMPGTTVRDTADDRTGQVYSRETSRNVQGPVQKITVEYPGTGSAVYTNEQISRLTVA